MTAPEDDLDSLVSHRVSVDEEASQGAWLIDLNSGREFLDFSGTWKGWALGHGIRGYHWGEFVDDLKPYLDKALYFKFDDGIRYHCELISSLPDDCFLTPDLEFDHASSAWESPFVVLGDSRRNVLGWMSDAWVGEAIAKVRVSGRKIFIDETKNFLGAPCPLLLTEKPWSDADGSLVLLDENRAIKFEVSNSSCNETNEEAYNVARLLDDRYVPRSTSDMNALVTYFQRVISEVVQRVEGIEILGCRGLHLWCRASSQSLRDALAVAAFDEGLLVGQFEARGLSFHVPVQAKADAVGRAAAQFESGISKTMSKMNRWLK